MPQPYKLLPPVPGIDTSFTIQFTDDDGVIWFVPIDADFNQRAIAFLKWLADGNIPDPP